MNEFEVVPAGTEGWAVVEKGLNTRRQIAIFYREQEAREYAFWRIEQEVSPTESTEPTEPKNE